MQRLFNHFFSILFRWQENFLVFGISAIVIITILGLVVLEKMSFLPKPITSLSSFTTNNKTMLQIMATINVLALLACVVIPLVSIFILSAMNTKLSQSNITICSLVTTLFLISVQYKPK